MSKEEADGQDFPTPQKIGSFEIGLAARKTDFDATTGGKKIEYDFQEIGVELEPIFGKQIWADFHRAGLRVGTALTEGTANFLVNRRMNKSQQMRWSRRGADRLLQVRCALYNGTLGASFGQRFFAANDALPKVAAAA